MSILRTNEAIAFIYSSQWLLDVSLPCMLTEFFFLLFQLGSTHLTFGDSLSTLPASVESFQEIFSSKNLTYQFDSYSAIVFPISETEEKQSNLHYCFSLKLIPYSNDKPTSPTSLLLPYTTLQSPGFNKIASVSTAPNAPHVEQIDEKEVINLENINEKYTADATMTIPKTFAYTLSLLDCSFNKRPFAGIWQLR